VALSLIVACAAACGGGGAGAGPGAASPADPAAPAVAGPALDPVPWRYEARFHEGVLDVEARFAPGTTGVPRVDDDAGPYVRDVTSTTDRGWRVVRYRYALDEAARAIRDVETASASGPMLVAPPSTWLLHPDAETPGLFRVHVTADAGSSFVASTHPAADGSPDTYEARADTLEGAGFAAFGRFHVETVTSGAARVLVAISPTGLALTDAEIAAWARSAVDAIGGYLHGTFPVRRTLVVLEGGHAGSSTRGETIGEGGPSVLLRAGVGLTRAKVRDDWVMTHELIHVVLPSLTRDHMWLTEGIPTYVEPIARTRAGLMAPEQMWKELVEGVPQGLPAAGDQGLEHTHTWGRTYWGGSLFCLLADVRIREATGNARSFDDAIRGIVATGADVESHWEMSQLLDVGDRATGTHVLAQLYQEQGLASTGVDLPALWRRLGVSVEGGRAHFDDAAPLAAVRRGIAGR
jgi:hypothetical protein